MDFVIDHLTKTKNYKIVFFGDSITSAEWVHPNWREIVEYVLKQELEGKFDDWKIPSWGIRTINSGFDGATTKDFLALLEEKVINYKPDLVIFMGTSNDPVLGLSIEEHTHNIKTILDTLNEEKIKTIYCTDISANNDKYNQKYEIYVTAVCKMFPYKNVQFVNMFEEYTKYKLSDFFTFVSSGNSEVGIKAGELDFIHPNPLGNAYIAKILLENVFNITYDPEKYMDEVRKEIMYPKY